jgi:glycosyltransferase involved in cell wall biosynthesis
MGAAPTRVVLAPAAFIHGDRIKLFKSLHRSKADCLRIFAGGNLEGRKGLALALQTLASLQKRGIPFEFTFAGYGPELSHIRKLAKQIALDPSRVRFRDSLPLDEYRQTLQQTDVYLLPSLRESGGLTLGEAMLAGCVPVVIRAGGPGLLVTPECGYAFEPDSPEHVVEQMTDALQRLWHDADHRERLSSNAVTRAETVLSEERYLKAVEGAYYATVKA